MVLNVGARKVDGEGVEIARAAYADEGSAPTVESVDTRSHRISGAVLLAASLLTMGLLGADILTGGGRLWFLSWNLALGWIPYLAAQVLHLSVARGHRVHAGAAAILWLLFLPNAPYLVTDAVHVIGQRTTSLEMATWAMSAITGMGIGCASLSIVHGVVARWLRAPAAWVFALTVSGLVSVGVYLGRFLRLNSWDALQEPVDVVAVIGRGLLDPRPFAVMAVAIGTAGFFTAYLAYCTAIRALLPQRASDTNG